MDSINEGFKDLTRIFFDENPNITQEGLRQRFIELSPGFENDPFFIKVIPIVYMIELCNRKILEQDSVNDSGNATTEKNNENINDSVPKNIETNNYIDVISSSYADITRRFMKENPNITLECLIKNFEGLCAGFKTDRIFKKMIPEVYAIESAKFKTFPDVIPNSGTE